MAYALEDRLYFKLLSTNSHHTAGSNIGTVAPEVTFLSLLARSGSLLNRYDQKRIDVLALGLGHLEA